MSNAGNWSKVPNEILDALAVMDGAGAKVAAVLVRQTLGYQRQECRMTWNDLQQATGLSRGGVAIGLRVIQEYGWFVGGRRSTWRLRADIWQRLNKQLDDKTVYSVDQKGDENSLLSRPQSTEQTKPDPQTVYSVDQNEVDHSLLSRPSSIKERETPSEFRGEKENAPPPRPYEQAVWEAAQRLVRQWCDKRGIFTLPDDGTEDGRANYFAPAVRIADLYGGDEAAAWEAVWAAYQVMLGDGLTPRRLAPVVAQALADMDRAAAPPRASPNGRHPPGAEVVLQDYQPSADGTW